MYHGDFTEFAPIALKLNVPLPLNPDGRTRQTGYNGNQHAYRNILEFLEGVLRHDKGHMAAMLAELRQVPGVTIVHETPVRNAPVNE